MATTRARYRDGKQAVLRWFYGAGQYWVLVVLALITMISYRGRWLPQMSPIDEGTYLDVIYKFPDDLVAQRGEFFGPEIREKFACDGNHLFGKAGPACGADYSNPNDFPQGGKTTADAYTPVFFWIAGIVSRILQFVGIDLTTGARLAMILFGVAAVVLTYRVMRMLNVPIVVGYSVLTLAMMSPVFWWMYGFVSTDASVPVFGALALLVTVGYLQGKMSIWWLVPVAAVGMFFKITTFLGIGLAALIVILYAAVSNVSERAIPDIASSRQLTTRAWLIPGVVSVFAGLLTFAGWEILRRLIAVGDSPGQGLAMIRTSFNELIFQTQLVFRSLVDADYGESATMPLGFLIARFLGFLVIAGVIGMMLRKPESRLEFSLTWATGIASVLFLPVLFVALRLGVVGFSLPPRYALAILPAMFISVALSIRWVGARWLIGIVTAVAWLYFVLSGMTYIP
ncbi:hypothetical protein INS90_03180 [Trueperella pecoris]|uniref:Glycosyltransferase RgtA/B/C/D-like domain-containing protein n=1 Tax=Trueperella pecoris TaxID=2733571 RepID=A0A7M1R290_9ACTO|nr:hypothetical protein [Trueperella pecoris]QOR48298.1 hypothetical protein INS90_03180 [Trueperella pecoris]